CLGRVPVLRADDAAVRVDLVPVVVLDIAELGVGHPRGLRGVVGDGVVAEVGRGPGRMRVAGIHGTVGGSTSPPRAGGSLPRQVGDVRVVVDRIGNRVLVVDPVDAVTGRGVGGVAADV